MVSKSKDAAKAAKALKAKAAKAKKAREMIDTINDEMNDGVQLNVVAAKKSTEEAGTTELQLVEVVELFTVSPGALMSGLDNDQYRRRKDRLVLVGCDEGHSDQSVYRSSEGLQFKVGESLMLECNSIDKAQRAKLNLGS